MITDSAAPTNRWRNLSTALQLSSVPISIQFDVDDVDQNISLLDVLTCGMKWVILQTFYRVSRKPGESFAKLRKWVSYKLSATFTSAISLHFFVRLNYRGMKYRSPWLHWPTATYLMWNVSFPHQSWSLKTQAAHRDSHSGPCAV